MKNEIGAQTWELYNVETGETLNSPYVYRLEPFKKRRDALAARDRWNHRFGTNVGVRKTNR